MGWGINSSGQVAGYSSLPNIAGQHTVRWTGTTAEDLGSLGGTNSYGLGINRFGTVVGSSALANGGGDAFYTVGNAMIDLNSLLPAGSNWQLTGANAINDDGWITGAGTINGQTHAYLLRPNAVPEPSALALFSLGTLAAGWAIQRRKR